MQGFVLRKVRTKTSALMKRMYDKFYESCCISNVSQ